MPARRARELCPQLIFVAGRFDEYQRLGDAAIKVLSDYTPLVERLSIDEAFADVAGCTRLFGPPAAIAQTIRRRVRAELGLPISVGVARTKHLAKIASQVAKPDGLVVVDPDRELAFLHDLPVGLMWGVGLVAEARLADAGVRTIGALAQADPARLEGLLGRASASRLAALAWNRDGRQIETQRRAQSAGAQSAGRMRADPRVLQPTLRDLADRVGARLRANARPGRTLTVRVRFADLRSVARSRTLPAPIAATASLAEVAEDLVRGVLADHPGERTVSLIGIAVSNLEPGGPAIQLELPLGLADEPRRPGTRQGLARTRADRAVDAVRNRFGWQAVRYGPAPASASVPDAFRRLAEKDL
jgi:DNA polymerase-4